MFTRRASKTIRPAMRPIATCSSEQALPSDGKVATRAALGRHRPQHKYAKQEKPPADNVSGSNNPKPAVSIPSSQAMGTPRYLLPPPIVAALLLLVIAASAGAQTWRATMLEAPPNFTYSCAQRININGDVAGVAWNYSNGTIVQVAVYWPNTPKRRMTYQATNTDKIPLNSFGQTLIHTPLQTVGAIWDGVVTLPLSQLQSGVLDPITTPSVLNDTGVIAGVAKSDYPPYALPVRWVQNIPSIMEAPTGWYVAITGINNSNTIVGTIVPSDPNYGPGGPVVWNESKLTFLRRPVAFGWAGAEGINNAGIIVGAATFPIPGTTKVRITPTKWVNGVPVPLTMPSGTEWGVATAISDRDDIVGILDSHYPVIWQSDGNGGHNLMPFNIVDRFGRSLADFNYYTSFEVNNINSARLIVGCASTGSFETPGNYTLPFVARPATFEIVDPLIDGEPLNLMEQARQSKDVSNLARFGRPVIGVAADGVAQLLLRIGTPLVGQTVTARIAPEQCLSRTVNQCGIEYGRIFDPFNPPHDVYSQAEIGQVSVQSVNTSNGPMAFFAYRAPVDFARSLDPSYAGTDANSQTRSVIIEVDGMRNAIAIHRPPVAFVHGLWSSTKNTWEESYKDVLAGHTNFYAKGIDYSAHVDGVIDTIPKYDPSMLASVTYSAFGIDFVSEIVARRAAQLLRDYRRERQVAVAKVDFVAHSLGGLAVRAMTRLPAYKESDNYWQGSVHKLITISTPHLGTPFATDGLKAENKCVRDVLASRGMIAAETIAVKIGAVVRAYPGAVGDLTGNGLTVYRASAALQRLAASQTKIPVAFTGAQTNESNLASLDYVLRNAWWVREWCSSSPLAKALRASTWNSVFGGLPNDGIVPVTSMNAGYGANSFAVTLTPGVIHSKGVVELGFEGPDIVNAAGGRSGVLQLLNTTVSDNRKFIWTPQ